MVYLEYLTVDGAIGDDGVPLDDENATRVFVQLFSAKAKGTGTGLVLSISKDIVEKRHGGRLMLASNDPVIFRIELPVAELVAP